MILTQKKSLPSLNSLPANLPFTSLVAPPAWKLPATLLGPGGLPGSQVKPENAGQQSWGWKKVKKKMTPRALQNGGVFPKVLAILWKRALLLGLWVHVTPPQSKVREVTPPRKSSWVTAWDSPGNDLPIICQASTARSSWWLNPTHLKNMLLTLEIFPNFRGENI